MAANEDPRPDDPGDNPEVQHEETDVNVRALLIFLGVLLASAAVIHVAMWGLFELFQARRVAEDPPRLPLALPEGVLPPEPRLQVYPLLDLHSFRVMEEERLTRYGWEDREAGIVRVPIDRAMDLLVERGVPVRDGAGPPPDPGARYRFADPSSGRYIGGRDRE